MKRLILSLFASAALLFSGLAPAQVATDAGKTGIARAAHLLCASAVAASVTGTTNETTLATCTIPAGAMGLSGGLLIYSTWTQTNNGNTKTIRLKHGGTNHMVIGVSSLASFSDMRKIRNRGASNSQIAQTSLSATSPFGGSGAVSTGSVDTSVSQDVVLTAQPNVGTDTMTLESYEVWLLP